MSSIFRVTTLLILIFVTAACSTSRTISSSKMEQAPGSAADLKPWIIANAERNNYDGLIYYVGNDAQFVYIYLEITNAEFARDTYRYGLTTYLDIDFRRSFGVTFPAGLLHGLSVFPGARKGFLENPSWENSPDNRALIATAERMMPEQALLLQRRDRRSDRNPVPVPVAHLEAQGMILMYDTSGRHPEILLRIPLEVTRNQQFAIGARPGQKIQLGFEVKPPEPEEIEREESITDVRDRYSYDQRQHQQQQARRNLTVMLRGGFTFWRDLKLAE